MKITEIIKNQPSQKDLQSIFDHPLTPGLALVRIEKLIPDHRLVEFLETLEESDIGDVRPQLARWIRMNRPDLVDVIRDRRPTDPSPLSPVSVGFIPGSD